MSLCPVYKHPHLFSLHLKLKAVESLFSLIDNSNFHIKEINKLSAAVLFSSKVFISSHQPKFQLNSMARSFANAKLLSALVQSGFPSVLTRRGYAAATQSATRAGVAASMSSKVGSKPGEDKAKGASTDKVSWVPDPVTGYYKPENIKEIDVAELRATLLAKKFNN